MPLEDRRDIRRIALDIGGHDHDVPRLKTVSPFQEGQEVVVEDFDFPQRAVAGVDLDGAVRPGRRIASSPLFCAGEVENIGLDIVEQGSPDRFLIEIFLDGRHIADLDDHVGEIPAELAEGSQERIPLVPYVPIIGLEPRPAGQGRRCLPSIRGWDSAGTG